MTPKEKAVRLVDTYIDEVINEIDIDLPLELPKRLALIAVDEILNNNNNFFNTYSQNDYWLQVKQEIEKL